MPRSTLLLVLLAACSGPPPEAPAAKGADTDAVAPVPVAASTNGRQEAEDVVAAAAAWRRAPGPDTLAAVQHACERGVKVQDPSPELRLALGDALSNVMLRPDLGVPEYEPLKDALPADARDGWLDALLREGDLVRLSSEHERFFGDPIEVDHATARVIAARAANDPTLHWQDVVRDVRAAHLVEDGYVASLGEIDRPLGSTGALLEAAGVLMEGWDVEVVTARTKLPDDPDALTTPGVIPAVDDTRRIVAYARGTTPEELRQPGVALDLLHPPRTWEVVVVGHAPGGGRVFVVVNAALHGDDPWLIGSNDVKRANTLLDARDELLDLRRLGRDDATAANALREKYQQRFLRGE